MLPRILAWTHHEFNPGIQKTALLSLGCWHWKSREASRNLVWEHFKVSDAKKILCDKRVKRGWGCISSRYTFDESSQIYKTSDECCLVAFKPQLSPVCAVTGTHSSLQQNHNSAYLWLLLNICFLLKTTVISVEPLPNSTGSQTGGHGSLTGSTQGGLRLKMLEVCCF